MSRNGARLRADIDTAIFEDPKFRVLARRHYDDPGTIRHAAVLYVSVLVTSWRTGEPVTAVEGETWWAPADPDIVSTLQDVGLLDAETRVPRRSFDHWYGPLERQLKAEVEGGRRGGIASGRSRRQMSRTRRNEGRVEASLQPEVKQPASQPDAYAPIGGVGVATSSHAADAAPPSRNGDRRNSDEILLDRLDSPDTPDVERPDLVRFIASRFGSVENARRQIEERKARRD